jgi:predicted lipid-binding transport protein (Tim44 family)
MEEDEREGHESQPEPETQPVSAGEATQEQPEPETEPQPAPTSSPGQPPSTSKERGWQFLLGLGIGLIPLVLFFIGFAPNAYGLIIISLLLLVIILIASLICIGIPTVHYIGYGLLTSIPISIVVGSIGCNVILSRPSG